MLQTIPTSNLSRAEMKNIMGGVAPAASEWNCGGTFVCWYGLTNPAGSCGFSTCDYAGGCEPAEIGCGGGAS
ncbi:hypothetical protein [Dinghuibacter silviterrae]|uniref:Uncharacterized protein n=1 Tax=Dinghuibacter silviterrae TaxID=1539049 RepID=A0A4R8DN79_9BACT|nr:hypothetical protein [Dinghuibacter silviterrae]TDW99155.1 hypothetical protein EDB95_0163 [Dinghuibacter silviterrae]